MSLFDKIQEATQFIQSQTDFKPQFGIILGTGLGDVTDEMQVVAEIAYKDIPHFPISTVQSHKGKLVFGYLADKAIVAMAGRFHYYEGYSMQEVTFPVRVLKFLGIQHLIISNVAGGTNKKYEAGDIVFVKDHINLQPENPLRGENDERLGVRFPDMKETYNRKINQKALKIAKKYKIRAFEGVYLALQGPNLETPAEYEFIHRSGADLVGMSTVPEVLVAKHSELPVFVVSVVSNKCYPIKAIKKTTVEDVIAMAKATEPKLRLMIREILNIL